MPVLTTLGAATAKAWGFLQQVAAAADPYFNYVTMLLTGNGTNGAQNNTFLDSSSNAFSITRNGNTTQGSFSPYGSLWSNYFGGSSYLLINHSSSFNLGTSDFCMECFINISSTPNLILGKESEYWLNYSRTDLGTTSNKIGFSISSSSGWFAVSSTTTPVVGVWYHIAAVRSGTDLSLYVNGVREGNITIPAGTFDAYSEPFNIGAWDYDPSSARMNGYISNVRFVKGSSVYSGSTITVPTTPLTAITNTVLLTCQSNRFIDNSSNAFAITVSGTPSVQRFSPFNPTASYSTATIGGSGYFDGSGDYLSVANNSAWDLGSNDFTVEAWCYPTSSGSNVVITRAANGSTYPTFELAIYSGTWRFYSSSSSSAYNVQLNSNVAPKLNEWQHVAVTRNGSTYTIWINGVSANTATSSASLYANSNVVGIGAYPDNTNRFYGYLSDVRLVNGTAVYSSTFTPSTAPLTAVTNTQLLCNFTNAGIPDSAMMNDLETVGNAQVSTSVKKFGTGSIAFDGSGDILQFPASQYWNFSSGDWTIEGWLYPNTVSGGQILLENTTDGTGGLSIQMNGSAFLVYINSTAINAGTFTASTWQHFALVRSGSTMTAYINGSSVGTSSTTPGSGATGLWIGSRSGGSISLNGYIDDLRITKGYARYTSNFTAPTAAFPTY